MQRAAGQEQPAGKGELEGSLWQLCGEPAFRWSWGVAAGTGQGEAGTGLGQSRGEPLISVSGAFRFRTAMRGSLLTHLESTLALPPLL